MDVMISALRLATQTSFPTAGSAASDASSRVHVVAYLNGDDPHHDRQELVTVKCLEGLKAQHPNHLSADVLWDRTPALVPPAMKAVVKAALLSIPAAATLGCAVAAVCTGQSDYWMDAALGGAITAYVSYLGFHNGTVQDIRENWRSAHSLRVPEPRWRGSREFDIAPSRTAALDSPKQLASYGVLSDFLVPRLQKYPAALHVLYACGHGNGASLSAGLAGDKFSQAMRETHEKSGQPLDVLFLESCLQGNLEVLAGIYPHARYAVVSEEVMGDFAGQEVLCNTLDQNLGRPLSPRQMADAMVDEAAKLPRRVGSEYLTAALVDMEKVPALLSAVDRLGDHMAREVLEGRKKTIDSILDETQRYPALSCIQLSTRAYFGDLKMLAENVVQEYDNASSSPHAADLKQAAQETLQTLKDAIPRLHTAPGYERAGGISLQLPPRIQSAFEGSAAPAGWKAFINAYRQ